jgi:hypothetical protein
MEDSIITLTTKIPISDIVNLTLKKNPQNKCEFNNLMIFYFLDIFLDKLNLQLNHTAGGKKRKYKYKNKTKNKKLFKVKKTKKSKKQRGGASPIIVLFLMSFLVVFINGITNLTDSDVIKRVKQVNEISELFKNYYGTCTLNTMLFLKTINIKTFEELSIDVMKTGHGLTNPQMAEYLNRELNINSRWHKISATTIDSMAEREINYEEQLELFIKILTDKLISLRSVYNFKPNQSIITAMNYKKKDKFIGHSVVIWLTSTNELVLIDPQKFFKNNIILFTTSVDRYFYDDKLLKTNQLKTYVRENIDITNQVYGVDIFESLHIEIDNASNDVLSQITSKELISTIGKIKQIEKEIGEERTEEL